MDFYQVANNVIDFVQANPIAQYSLIALFIFMLIRYSWFRWTVAFTILLPLGVLWFMVHHDNVNSTNNQNQG